ncbi:MAG TPA: hypothetical protein VF599_21920 [Pyrinomonadaceae bacterium]|jgi:hypothetical protein
MRKRLTEQKIRDLIQGLELEPLKITVLKQASKAASEPTGNGGGGSGDVLLNITWKTGAEKFVAEILGQATPKQIETRILRLEKYPNATASGGEQRGKNRFYPLIIAPYLSEKTLNRLTEAEISGIDLSGNGVVVIPDRLFVYRTGEKNKFLSNAPIKNIFRGTSSLVARVFFAKPEYEGVGEVLEEITKRGGRTTFSTVSKVLKALEEELLVSKNEKIKLVEAKKLLDSLLKNYRPPDVRRTLSVKCAADLSLSLKRLSENAESRKVLYARHYPERFAALAEGVAPVKIYAESINGLLDGVDFTETGRFPDMTLLETDQPTVYFDRRKDKDLYLVSPLETFLQLSIEGKREQEGANSMIKRLLEFKY